MTKSIEKPRKMKIGNDFQFARRVCVEALNAVEGARQKCMAAGHVLLELKEVCNGDFMDRVSKEIPEISHKTATIWMRAASNIAKALPAPPEIEIEGEVISVSEILTRDELPAEAQEWKQLWLEFTEGKTIKECMAGVLVDGDEEHRMDRAINGMTKGGGGGDRKDWPLFVARKFRDASKHLAHWDSMEKGQQSEVISVLTAAIMGEEIQLRGGRGVFGFELWPKEVMEAVREAILKRIKGGNR